MSFNLTTMAVIRSFDDVYLWLNKEFGEHHKAFLICNFKIDEKDWWIL